MNPVPQNDCISPTEALKNITYFLYHWEVSADKADHKGNSCLNENDYFVLRPTDLVCPPPPVNLLLPVKTKNDEEKELKEAKSLQWCQNPKCREIGSW